MNVVLLAVMLAVLPEEPGPVVSVQIEGGAERATPALLNARALATEMFATAGVRLEWCEQAKQCLNWNERLVVTLRPTAPSRLPASVRAEAQAFQGRNLWIYLDRMPRTSIPNAHAYWAHVLVHEITHLLQVSDQHTESGIMKAHWNVRDVADMQVAPLSFTAFDIRMLHAGLVHRELSASLRSGYRLSR